MLSENQLKAIKDAGIEVNTLIQSNEITYVSAQIPMPSQIGNMLLCGPGVIVKNRNNVIEVENIVVTPPFVWINFLKNAVPSGQNQQQSDEEE